MGLRAGRRSPTSQVLRLEVGVASQHLAVLVTGNQRDLRYLIALPRRAGLLSHGEDRGNAGLRC